MVDDSTAIRARPTLATIALMRPFWKAAVPRKDPGTPVAAPADPDRVAERERALARQVLARGVHDGRVLAALRRVPRHEFVPASERVAAYGDHPLAIGLGQTISQPYIVAFMTEQLGLVGGEAVLEIGTGSGYQAAVLAEIAGHVHTIEIVAALADDAQARLTRLGYRNVSTRSGDGYLGWPEAAPFDAIMVTAAAPYVPEPLRLQLKDGGRLIVPVGDQYQELLLVTRNGDAWDEKRVLPVRFVPMIGHVRQRI
jgi:protein-L-isoaspartate(D-aspartate) O-methyltransferase